MLQEHRRHEDKILCRLETCSLRTEYLRKHEIKCNQEKIKISCEYCEKERGKTLHEKLKHRIKSWRGYVLLTEEATNKSTENICKT